MSPERQAEAISELAGFPITETTFDATVRRLVEIARESVRPADLAGLTVVDEHGEPTSPYFTDDLVAHIDVVQYESDRGPCIDAWRHRRTVRIGRLDPDRARYPEFASSARRAGVESVLAVPLLDGNRSIGALNLYSRRVDAFDESDEVAARRVAESIAIAITNAEAYWSAHELSRQLEEAMQSRAVIEQAKGVLMANMGCDADEAFDLLRQQSQHENRKLRVIAAEIVARQKRDR